MRATAGAGLALGRPGFGPASIIAEPGSERWAVAILLLAKRGVAPLAPQRPGHPRQAAGACGRLRPAAGAGAPPATAGAALGGRPPGELFQYDCCSSGTVGTAWQYTAIGVASAHVWPEVRTTPSSPSTRSTRALSRRGPPTWPASAGGWRRWLPTSKLGGRSPPTQSAGCGRMRGSGSRPPSLSDRSQRSSTPGRLITLVDAATVGGPIALLGNW